MLKFHSYVIIKNRHSPWLRLSRYLPWKWKFKVKTIYLSLFNFHVLIIGHGPLVAAWNFSISTYINQQNCTAHIIKYVLYNSVRYFIVSISPGELHNRDIKVPSPAIDFEALTTWNTLSRHHWLFYGCCYFVVFLKLAVVYHWILNSKS
jgi:hypothetical protein